MLNEIFEITYYGMTCTNDKLYILNPSTSVNTVWKVMCMIMAVSILFL